MGSQIALRLLVGFAAGLLAVGVLAALLAPGVDRAQRPEVRTVPPAVPEPAGALVRARVDGDGAGQLVRARVGDRVELAVEARSGDRLAVEGLAAEVPVGPGLDAALLVRADRPGRFPLRLRYADRSVGALLVR